MERQTPSANSNSRYNCSSWCESLELIICALWLALSMDLWLTFFSPFLIPIVAVDSVDVFNVVGIKRPLSYRACLVRWLNRLNLPVIQVEDLKLVYVTTETEEGRHWTSSSEDKPKILISAKFRTSFTGSSDRSDDHESYFVKRGLISFSFTAIIMIILFHNESSCPR